MKGSLATFCGSLSDSSRLATHRSLALLLALLLCAPSICTASTADGTNYVCKRHDCDTLLEPGTRYFPTITGAIEDLAQNTSFDGAATIFVVADDYPEMVLLPPAVERLLISQHRITPGNSTKVAFEGLRVEKNAMLRFLSLDRVSLVSPDNSVIGLWMKINESVTLSLSHVHLDCRTLLEVGQRSVVQWQNVTIGVDADMAVGELSQVKLEYNVIKNTNLTIGEESEIVMSGNQVIGDAVVTLQRNASLLASGNRFQVSFHTALRNSWAHFQHNTFETLERAVKFNESLTPNLLLELSCNVGFSLENNTFVTGTLQFSETSSDHNCTYQLDSASSLRRNRFSKPSLVHRLYDLLKDPAEHAITYSKGLHNALVKGHQIGLHTIDASHNWWGHSGGPYLCCNEKGLGAYTALSINTSMWCLDSLCTRFSNISLPDSCVRFGCQQKLTRADLVVFILSASLAVLILLSSIIFNIYHNIKHFNSTSFQKYPLSHLLPKAHKQYRVGIIASTLGSVLTQANIYILIVSTMRTNAHAHQHIMPFRAYAILWAYSALATLQILINITGLLASFLNWRIIMRRVITLSYAFNVFNVVCTTVVTLEWIPTGGFVDLLSHFFLTISSPLINLLFVSSILVCLISVTAFIPVRLMNRLFYHYDSARINAALEIALLKELIRSPEIEAKARRLRIMTVCTIIAALIPTVATFYDVSIDQYFRLRLIMSAVQHLLGIGSLCAIIGVTFYYNQDLLLTLISVVLSVATIGCAQDIIFWANYLAITTQENSKYSQRYVVFKFLVSVVWLVALAVEHIMVYHFNRDVMTQLPAKAIDNLNHHIDHTIDTAGVRERTPLFIISDSETDEPRGSEHIEEL